MFVVFELNYKDNHKVELYIGEQQYSVPWQYNPRKSYENRGIDIWIRYPSFSPQYEYTEEGVVLLISKILDEPKEKDLDSHCSGMCALGADTPFYFSDGQAYYSVYVNRGDKISKSSNYDFEKFKQDIIKIFNSFKASDEV